MNVDDDRYLDVLAEIYKKDPEKPVLPDPIKSRLGISSKLEFWDRLDVLIEDRYVELVQDGKNPPMVMLTPRGRELLRINKKI